MKFAPCPTTAGPGCDAGRGQYILAIFTQSRLDRIADLSSRPVVYLASYYAAEKNLADLPFVRAPFRSYARVLRLDRARAANSNGRTLNSVLRFCSSGSCHRTSFRSPGSNREDYAGGWNSHVAGGRGDDAHGAPHRLLISLI